MSQASIVQRLLNRLQNGAISNSTTSNNNENRHRHQHPISEDQTELQRFQTLRLTHAAANTNNHPPVIRSTLNSFLNSSPEGDTALHTLLLLRPSARVVREMIRLYPEVRLLLASLRYCFGDLLQFQNLTKEFVNARNHGGATALHVALRCGCAVQVVDVLLDEGALEYARYRELEHGDDEDGEDEESKEGYRCKPSLASVPMNAGTYPLHLACYYPSRIIPHPPQQQAENEQQQQQDQPAMPAEDHQRPIIERLVAEDPKIVTKMAGWGNTPLASYWQPEYQSCPHYNSKSTHGGINSNSTTTTTLQTEQDCCDILSALDEMDWTSPPPKNSDFTHLNEDIANKITEKWEVSLLLLSTAESLRKRGPWSGYDNEDEEEGYALLCRNNSFLKTLCKTPFVPPVMIQLALLFGHAEELSERDEESGYLPLHYAASTCMIFSMPKRDDGELKSSSTRFVRRGKRQKDTDMKAGSVHEEEEINPNKQKIYRSAVEVLTTAYPSAASKRDLIEQRLPLHIAALKMKQWDGCVECLVSSYPEALVMRDPVTGLFPFMLAAVSDEDGSTRPWYIDDTNDKEKEIRMEWSRNNDNDDDDQEKDEEDGQLTVVFELLRCSPEILSFGELGLLTWGDEEKKKISVASRSSMLTSTTRRTGKRVWSFFSSLLGTNIFSSSLDDSLNDTSQRPQKRRRVN